MRAFCTIRPEPCYRREAFLAGLKAAGLEARAGRPPSPAQCDVLVIWNRYDEMHRLATEVEHHGGTVLVAENGYFGVGGSSPKFDVVKGPQPGHYYALAKGGHNGQGIWPEGDGSRFARLGAELKPWRAHGEHVVVLANRSFGIPGRMQPPDWPQRVMKRLAAATKRPLRLRAHPGNDAPRRPLSADLEGAWAAVVWSSSAGLHALAAGIPVVCEAPYWIGKGAAWERLDYLETSEAGQPRLDRQGMFERMAWAQWTLEEIATGEPFRKLLA